MLPGALLQGWVGERRDDSSVAEDAYRRALDLAERAGFGDHAAFALAGLGSTALAAGDLGRAEQLLRQAVDAAEAAAAPWVAAHARVELGRALAAAGGAATAEQLFRSVLEWSELPRSRRVRETLFVALVADPPTAALLGLADLADARGDSLSAGDLRRRAALPLA